MKLPWPTFWAELAGSFLLVAVGCSWVILDFGQGSPLARWLPDVLWRRALTGFLFGATGALIAVSPLGKVSGAHLNPVVSLAFWGMGKLQGRYVLGYWGAQLIGASLGGLPLLLWGSMGRSVAYAATVPGSGPGVALLGEAVTTFMLGLGLFSFLGQPRLRPYTPLLFPGLYALMVAAEAPLSGTSTNPARSLGPAWVAGVWSGYWVYWVGPLLGMALAVLLLRLALPRLQAEVTKVYHFDHDPHRVFRVN